MFDLFKQYYDDVDQESFLKDLSEKNFIILLWDKNQNQKEYLFGFSTILKKHLEEKGILIFVFLLIVSIINILNQDLINQKLSATL